MNKANAPSVIAILVSYYPIYIESCLVNLRKLLDNHSQIVIVNNSTAPLILSDPSLPIIQGSNKGWEFSAWDEGIEYVSNIYENLNSSTFVLVNDTFYEHRIFTYIDSYLFKKSIMKVTLRNYDIAGEFNSFGERFIVQGIESTGWLSTYMFIVHGIKLGDLSPLCKVKAKDLIDVDKINEKINLPDCSKNLALHLESWIFPKNKKLGWYGGQSNSDNTHLLNMKIKTILNEKLVHAVAENNQLKIGDVYGNLMAKVYLLGRKFIYKFITSPLKLHNK